MRESMQLLANFLSRPYSSMPRDEAAALRVAARRVSTTLRATSQHSSRNDVTSCSVGTCHVDDEKNDHHQRRPKTKMSDTHVLERVCGRGGCCMSRTCTCRCVASDRAPAPPTATDCRANSTYVFTKPLRVDKETLHEPTLTSRGLSTGFHRPR